MAGIGFDLRRLCLEDESLLAHARAYATAGVVAAGPWLVTMASLWLVRVASSHLTEPDMDRFLSIVCAVFAASLITMGGLQMAATRWLADTLFRGSHGALAPAFGHLFAWVAVAQTVCGSVGCLAWGLDLALVTPVTLLYVAVSLSWLAFVWLSLVRQHDRILWTFLIGGGTFVAVLAGLGDRVELQALVWIYALANSLIVAILAVLVLRGTEAGDERSLLQLRGLLGHKTLWWVGTVYAVALWADKFVFWWLDGAQGAGVVPHHPLYDTCFYAAYLTVVPALAVNLVHLETGFYEQYRGYYAAIESGATLREIRGFRRRMGESLRAAAASLLRVQGATTFVCLLFAPELAALAGLPAFGTHTLRLALIGAFCHVLLLITVLVLLYFDRRRAALRTVLVFLGANVAFALASVAAGPPTYGLGYTLAALLALVVGLLQLRSTLAQLDHLTFSQQH